MFLVKRKTDTMSGDTKFQIHSDSEPMNKKSQIPETGGKEISYRFPLNLHGNPFPVLENEGPFSNFYLDKISKNVREKYPKAHYELEKNTNQEVTAVIWYNINDYLRKELDDALEWTLRKTEENRKAGF